MKIKVKEREENDNEPRTEKLTAEKRKGRRQLTYGTWKKCVCRRLNIHRGMRYTVKRFFFTIIKDRWSDSRKKRTGRIGESRYAYMCS